MKLPVVSISLTLNEIPDHLAVAIELGNCKRNCKGCHSPWLSYKLPRNKWADFEYVMCKVNEQVKKGANAIVIMGGTYNGIPTADLIEAINILSHYAPVGIYSGLPYAAAIHKDLRANSKLTWLKTGSYIRKLGGLTLPTTNQQFFERRADGAWEDITHVFQVSGRSENDRNFKED